MAEIDLKNFENKHPHPENDIKFNDNINIRLSKQVVSAVFQKFGIRNANGRVYPERLLKEAVEKYQQAIKERRSFGCLNHPESTDEVL